MKSKTDRNLRRLQHLFNTVIPILLSKPTSRWTKQELWHAIDLYLKRPYNGLISSFYYSELESKLKREADDSPYSPPHEKRGRPRLRTDKTYREHLKMTEIMRKILADERNQKVEEVTDKDIARRIAEGYLSTKMRKPADYQISRQAYVFQNHIKALKKKKKGGEI